MEEEKAWQQSNVNSRERAQSHPIIHVCSSVSDRKEYRPEDFELVKSASRYSFEPSRLKDPGSSVSCQPRQRQRPSKVLTQSISKLPKNFRQRYWVLEMHEVGDLVELSKYLQAMLYRRRKSHSKDEPLSSKNTYPISLHTSPKTRHSQWRVQPSFDLRQQYW